ncbi:phosphopantothenoylcysteine decarboxylase isoform X2 [Molossus molossus]|uniref:phosphopantothenoylcysteine decarboxylase isoform X2 n=1 Tax=Molossus molossus TaxID=27622 RepID=UPI001746E9D0|nr:phosphopantothenoylcysteine decarboxylase isoform X2 [Molossus molossus]
MEPRASCPAAAPLVERQFHVLVGVTGSVAALKLPLLVSRLLDIPGMWKCRSDPVLHIDLRRWADLMLVAPLDANTLGKVASGICDNLLTCVIRAWDLRKPLLFCPAMNTAMWEHPITSQQVGQLQAFGYIEIPCVAKKLVCGDKVCFQAESLKVDIGKVWPLLSRGLAWACSTIFKGLTFPRLNGPKAQVSTSFSQETPAIWSFSPPFPGIGPASQRNKLLYCSCASGRGLKSG